MDTRFIREYGRRADLRVYWGDDCPNCIGKGSLGYHNARFQIGEVADPNDQEVGGELADYPRTDPRWPTKCDDCPAAVPPTPPPVLCECGCGEEKIADGAPRYHIFRTTLFTDDKGWIGIPQPGDLFWVGYYHTSDGVCFGKWTNCSGQHLVCVLPNGDWWDTGSRASNCTMREDTTHRCWVVNGDPRKGELVTVNKASATCAAGAGSIISGNYHGFLTNGKLTSC